MKYQPITTLYLLILFTLTQLVGLYVTNYYQASSIPYNLESPMVSDGWSIYYLFGGILLMTIIFYLLTRLKYERFLKLWFSAAIIISMSLTLSAFIGEVMGLIIAIILSLIRLSTKDLYVHNITELLVYGGIVSIFAPLFSPLTALIVLIIIAVYDYVSVFVTKHMVYLAQSQSSANLFTGLIVKRGDETAILGGGDIAFSLLFATVLGSAYSLINAYLTIYAVIIAISFLTILGQKGKFYPAMPFITIACAISYLLALI
ncbi:MAG: presenilin family intramembrane aspartyl protease [Candidatus Nanoarchaeia archaeon]|jgi:presenilin-like A22 family membrane protease